MFYHFHSILKHDNDVYHQNAVVNSNENYTPIKGVFKRVVVLCQPRIPQWQNVEL